MFFSYKGSLNLTQLWEWPSFKGKLFSIQTEPVNLLNHKLGPASNDSLGNQNVSAAFQRKGCIPDYILNFML